MRSAQVLTKKSIELARKGITNVSKETLALVNKMVMTLDTEDPAAVRTTSDGEIIRGASLRRGSSMTGGGGGGSMSGRSMSGKVKGPPIKTSSGTGSLAGLRAASMSSKLKGPPKRTPSAGSLSGKHNSPSAPFAMDDDEPGCAAAAELV